MKRFFNLLFFTCMLVLAGILPSCRSNGPEGPGLPSGEDAIRSEKTVRGLQKDDEEEVIKMPGDVVFVKDDINSSLKSYNPEKGTITYENVPAMMNADIKVGDVLYSMPVEGVAPDGYIVKVTGIRQEGNKVIYEVEEAALADAFDYIDTEIPLAFENIDESCVTVYDPFEQADQSDRINDIFSQGGISTKGDLGDLDPTLEWENDRWELKAEKEKTTLEIVLQDEDGDYKETKNDQIRLMIHLTYDFLNKGVVGYHFDAKSLVYSVDMKPNLGVSIGLLFFKEKGEINSGDITSQKKKKELMDEMESKLLGKKICIGHFEIPVGAASILVKPRFEVYLFFKMNMSGELEVEAGIEDIPVRAHLENLPMSPLIDPFRSSVKIEHKPKCFFRVDANVDVKGALGVGAGFAVGLPKLLSDKNDVAPYAGLFYDATVNGKAKIKMISDMTDLEMKTTLSAEAYVETVGYAEAYAHLKKDIIFNGKLEINKTRYPEEDSDFLKWDTTFVRSVPVPEPQLVRPAHREATEKDLTLEWRVPCRDNYGPYRYDVFISEDKTVVEQSNTRARVAHAISEESLAISVSAMKTYYWRVRCTDMYGREFDSEVFTFDTGSDGVVPLPDALKRYFAVNFNALDDVYFQDDGTLLRTPSNIRALERITSLVINDPENKFGITNIDGILMALPSLELLDCSFNSLQSLYLVENPKLKALTCHHNALKELDLQYTPSLTSLSCSDNVALKELDVSPCTELAVLKCDRCGLASLDLSSSPKLTDLFVSENYLDFLDITWAKNLIRLDFHAQFNEWVTLRLTARQKENFALLLPHVNTDYDYGDPVTVQTGEAVNVTSTSADIPVTVKTESYWSERGVVYSTTANPQLWKDHTVVCDTSEDSYAVSLEGLEPATLYYACGYVFNSSTMAVHYGNVVSFTTESSPLLSIEPEEYEFGEVEVGESEVYPIKISNTGEGALHVSISCPEGPFSSSLTGASVRKNETVVAYITFAPTSEGDFKCIFSVQADDPRGNQTFTVWGTGVSGNDSPGDGSVSIPDVVDIGLSVGWAAFNIGATKPEEYGNYYAWGETEPNEKGYDWSSYKWCSGTETSLTKYNTKSSYGIVDNKIELDADDDVARVRLGGKWRMPTREELEELMATKNDSNYKWEWKSYNGCKGYLITCLENNNSLFFPAAGYMSGQSLNDETGNVYCLSTSLSYSRSYSIYPECAAYASFYHGAISDGPRCEGHTVRAVCKIVVHPKSVSLSRHSMLMYAGGYDELTVSFNPSNTTNKQVSWRSSDARVATVDEYGRVHANAVGTTIITVETVDGNYMDQCEVTVKTADYSMAVDIGLSVRWASCNLGASSPEEYGDYYAWGEIRPKESYNNGTYKWLSHGFNGDLLTKYNYDSAKGIVDDNDELDRGDDYGDTTVDDVARAVLGGKWRIPTKSELEELVSTRNYNSNYQWEWTSINGHNGWRVTYLVNNSSIFLPAAGEIYDYDTADMTNSYGRYWSSSLGKEYSSEAYHLRIHSGGVATARSTRYAGYSVRPVTSDK